MLSSNVKVIQDSSGSHFSVIKYICVSSSNVLAILCVMVSVIQQSALAVNVWLLGEGQRPPVFFSEVVHM